MGGKSTYLRQVALLCLLAQSGSFVPAREAKVGIVDRIYARVGASDNIARGQSTFMVEMQETAHILNGATSRSLVVLDEIGRGTATFDGLSIAWAVAEHLAKNAPGASQDAVCHALSRAHRPRRRAAGRGQRARRRRASGRTRLFSCTRSCPAARIGATASRWRGWPGLPPPVIARARDILIALEHDELSRGGRPALSGEPSAAQQQLGLFQAPVERDDVLRERFARARPQSNDPARSAADSVGPEEGTGMTDVHASEAQRLRAKWLSASLCLCGLFVSGSCGARPSIDPNVITLAVFASPNNFDPRVGTDEVSQKVYQLVLRQPPHSRRRAQRRAGSGGALGAA